MVLQQLPGHVRQEGIVHYTAVCERLVCVAMGRSEYWFNILLCSPTILML
jgi:hypothetical protein